MKGKFILSYNDCDFVRDLYKDFNIDEVERNLSFMSRYKDKGHTYSKLIIKNY